MAKRKIILFYAKTGWDTPGVTTGLPLSTLFIAAPLHAAGYDVVMVDERTMPDWKERLTGALRSGDVLTTGISSMTGRQIAGALEATTMSKQLAPDVPVTWGGVHATMFPEMTLRDDRVDYVVMGEGEESFLKLVQAIEKGGPFEGILGTGYKDGGKPVINPPAPPPDLGEVPALPYDLLPMKEYITSKVMGERDLIYLSSRGCPYSCTYCIDTIKDSHNRVWRGHTPKKITEDVIEMRERWGVNAIIFQDDMFFVRKDWVEEICQRFIEAKLHESIKFRADCRIDGILRFDMDFLRLVRKAGFVQLYIGVESGSNRILKMIKKGITREKVLEANRKLREVDIAPKYSFMAGFPTETLDEAKQTLSLMSQLTTENPKATTTNCHLFTPYPGTELYRWCKDNGMTFPEKLTDWVDYHWNRMKFQWLDKKHIHFLESASYFTYFIDGHTVSDWYASRPIMHFLTSMYGKLIRLRAKHQFYGFMPEVKLVRYLKEKAFEA